ncbi:6-phosphogluconolactonase [Terrabacter tumescens]|uniref:6-phosphogluconolactonase n=1 Tax=Terrabacter tumescens TaxID=60443 RepID=A0ABQ2I9V8_9MICO|nr:6-phosphogluconolactonase [Terrabacter tumescens]GGN04768.1 6-phosphogluconolactonase [Terrabacter tumescens]
MTAAPRVVVHPSKQILADAAAARLVGAIVDAQAERGVAHVALTGGSMGSAIIASLAAVPGRLAIDPTRLHLWWGDERYLPAGDADRNDTQNDEAGLASFGIPAEHVHRVAGPDSSESPEASALAYGEAIREHGQGSWDVVLFGVGPDGHVASLFPHHPAQRITDAIAVAVHDSPKPPPDRVSLTFECFERSHQVWFLVSGADKAEAVAAALAPGADRWDVPAAGPRGSDATLWLVDADAASGIG